MSDLEKLGLAFLALLAITFWVGVWAGRRVSRTLPADRGLPTPASPAPQLPPIKSPRPLPLRERYIQRAFEALQRPMGSACEIEDGLRSAEFFIQKARDAAQNQE